MGRGNVHAARLAATSCDALKIVGLPSRDAYSRDLGLVGAKVEVQNAWFDGTWDDEEGEGEHPEYDKGEIVAFNVSCDACVPRAFSVLALWVPSLLCAQPASRQLIHVCWCPWLLTESEAENCQQSGWRWAPYLASTVCQGHVDLSHTSQGLCGGQGHVGQADKAGAY